MQCALEMCAGWEGRVRGATEPETDASPGRVVLSQYFVFAGSTVIVTEGFYGVF